MKNYFIEKKLTANLQDENLIAMAHIFDKFLHLQLSSSKASLIYPTLDFLSEDLINHVGFQQHIERFSESLSLDSKKDLIRNSFLLHKKKGTPWALRTAISAIIAPTQILEWYKYDGRPYYFKPIINLSDARLQFSGNEKRELLNVIEEWKNTRSWLDGIILKADLEDQTDLPLESFFQNINVGYEEEIIYAAAAECYSENLFNPYYYRAARAFDNDDLFFNVSMCFDDIFQLQIQYPFKIGFAEYGALERKPTETAQMIINRNWKYGAAIYGEFKYGEVDFYEI